ncbi:MAG: hypothetical protein SOH60_06920 [Lachnospiraceae bacterium]|jgi:hypothetical protein
MTSFRKFQAAALGALLALSLTACGSSGDTGTAASTLFEAIPAEDTAAAAESTAAGNAAAADGADAGSTTAADTSFSNTTTYTVTGVYLFGDGITADTLDPAAPDLSGATAISADNSRYTIIDGGDCLFAIASLTGAGQSVATMDLTCRNDSKDTYTFSVTCYVNGNETDTETTDVTNGSRRGINIPIDDGVTPNTVFLSVTVTDSTTGTALFTNVPAVMTLQ